MKKEILFVSNTLPPLPSAAAGLIERLIPSFCELGYSLAALTIKKGVFNIKTKQYNNFALHIASYFPIMNKVKHILGRFGFNAIVTIAAHNIFIEFFYHYGILGLILWISYFLYCAKLFRRNSSSFANKSPMVFISLLAGAFF